MKISIFRKLLRGWSSLSFLNSVLPQYNNRVIDPNAKVMKNITRNKNHNIENEYKAQTPNL